VIFFVISVVSFAIEKVPAPFLFAACKLRMLPQKRIHADVPLSASPMTKSTPHVVKIDTDFTDSQSLASFSLHPTELEESLTISVDLGPSALNI